MIFSTAGATQSCSGFQLNRGWILSGNSTYLHRVGKGAYAGVWKATDPLGRTVAVKVFEPTETAAFAAMPHAEVLAKVSHPNVVVVHQACRVPDPLDPTRESEAVLMEFLPGESLAERLMGEVFEVETAASVANAALRGLEAIYAAGLAHGDLHDGNLVLDTAFGAKVIDLHYRGSLASLREARLRERQRQGVVTMTQIIRRILGHTPSGGELSLKFLHHCGEAKTIDDLRAALSAALTTTPEINDEPASEVPRPADQSTPTVGDRWDDLVGGSPDVAWMIVYKDDDLDQKLILHGRRRGVPQAGHIYIQPSASADVIVEIASVKFAIPHTNDHEVLRATAAWLGRGAVLHRSFPRHLTRAFGR